MDTTGRPAGYTPKSLSPPEKALPDSPLPSDNPSRSGFALRSGDMSKKNKNESVYPGSHLAISPQTLQKVPSYADFARMALSDNYSQGATGTNAAASNQPSRTREPRPATNRTTDMPATTSASRQKTVVRGDTSGLDVGSKTRPQGGQSTDDTQGVPAYPVSRSPDVSSSKEVPTSSRIVPPMLAFQETDGVTSFGHLRTEEPAEVNQSPLPLADLSRERNAIRPRATQQVDRIASTQPSPKPSTHSAPPLKQPAVSTSSRVAPTITKTASSWTRAPRGLHSGEPPLGSGGVPSELRHPQALGEDKGKAYPNEQSHTSSSAVSHRPPLSPEHATSTPDPRSFPQPVSEPHRLDRSNSRMQGNDALDREAKRTAEGPSTDKNERKRAIAPGGREHHREDSGTNSFGVQLRKAEPNPPSSYAPDIRRNLKGPQEGSVERTYSSGPIRGYDSRVTRLHDTSETRGKVVRPSDSVSSLSSTEPSISPPPPALLSTQSQLKRVIGVPPSNSSANSSTDALPRIPGVVGDSRIQTSPSLSRSIPSRVFAPIAPTASQREGETRPVPILPSASMRSVSHPYSTAVPLAFLNGPPTQTLRETSSDTPLRLPGDHGETHARMGSPHETTENEPRAEPSDRMGLVQSSTQPPPSIKKSSSNLREERGSRAQPRHIVPGSQHPPYDNKGIPPPNEQHHTDASTTRNETPSSEHSAATGISSSQYHVQPFIGYLVTPSNPGNFPIHPDLNLANFRQGHTNVDHYSPPPPYESKAPGVPVTQEDTSSRPGTGISSGVRDEPITTSLPTATAVVKTPSNLTGSTQRELPGEPGALPGLPPELLQSPDKGKGLASPNEQGQASPSEELKGILSPPGRPAAIATSPSQPDSQSPMVYRNRAQMVSPGVKQLNTSPKLRSASSAFSTSWGNSSDPRMETPMETGSGPITIQPAPRERLHPLVNDDLQVAELRKQPNLLRFEQPLEGAQEQERRRGGPRREPSTEIQEGTHPLANENRQQVIEPRVQVSPPDHWEGLQTPEQPRVDQPPRGVLRGRGSLEEGGRSGPRGESGGSGALVESGGGGIPGGGGGGGGGGSPGGGGRGHGRQGGGGRGRTGDGGEGGGGSGGEPSGTGGGQSRDGSGSGSGSGGIFDILCCCFKGTK